MLRSCCRSSILEKTTRYNRGGIIDKADKRKKTEFCFASFVSSLCFSAYECIYSIEHGIATNSENKGTDISACTGVNGVIHKNEDAPHVNNDIKVNPVNERVKIIVINTRIIAVITVNISLVRLQFPILLCNM